MELAGDGKTFPHTRFVVFADGSWDGRKSVKAAADEPEPDKAQRDIKELETAIQRARQIAERLVPEVSASMHVGNDLTSLTLTLHLAKRATGPERDKHIIKGISAADSLIERIGARTIGGGGSARGGTRHLAPAARLLAFESGFQFGPAGPAAFSASPTMPYISTMSAFRLMGGGKLF